MERACGNAACGARFSEKALRPTAKSVATQPIVDGGLCPRKPHAARRTPVPIILAFKETTHV